MEPCTFARFARTLLFSRVRLILRVRDLSPWPGPVSDDGGHQEQDAEPGHHGQRDGAVPVAVPLAGELLQAPLAVRLGGGARRRRAGRRRRRDAGVGALLDGEVERLAVVVFDGGAGGDLEVGAALGDSWPWCQIGAGRRRIAAGDGGDRLWMSGMGQQLSLRSFREHL